ncbi:MAG TPA: ATP-binding protein [Thermoplasmata archaeon]|nr:ATP-binding protein [Thermoplasmata archaeon]
MELTAAERVLLHLHGFWNVPEPGRDATQAGIAEGARLLRSHVPRTLRSLQVEGLLDSRDTRLRGQTRKVRVYALTEAGVRRARQVLSEVDATRVEIDGRSTSLGDARKSLGLTPLAGLTAIDAQGRLMPRVAELERPSLLGRQEDLAALRRWLAGAATVAVVYGSRGMGKSALGWAFAESVPRSVWVEIEAGSDLEGFATSLASATGIPAAEPDHPESVGQALADAFARGAKLLVLDGYGEVPEEIVDAVAAFLRGAGPNTKLLVLAQESTPAYCRFYGKKDVDAGRVMERHLRGLGLDDCRAMLRNPTIDQEALRRIFLLTKGCPLYLRAIREGDEATLRATSRFTNAEIRLLLYSRGLAA